MKHASSAPGARPTSTRRPGRPAASPPTTAPAARPNGAAAEGSDTAPESRDARIQRLAYARWVGNGCVDGHALDDWLAAEAEVCGRPASPGGDGAPPRTRE